MATRRRINISGNYVVHHKLYAFFHKCALYLKNDRSDKIVFYIGFKTQRPSDTMF